MLHRDLFSFLGCLPTSSLPVARHRHASLPRVTLVPACFSPNIALFIPRDRSCALMAGSPSASHGLRAHTWTRAHHHGRGTWGNLHLSDVAAGSCSCVSFVAHGIARPPRSIRCRFASFVSRAYSSEMCARKRVSTRGSRAGKHSRFSPQPDVPGELNFLLHFQPAAHPQSHHLAGPCALAACI